MRKLKYHCATSLDGYVADKDGRFDGFMMEGPHVADFVESLPTYGVALMGRKTYELGLRAGVTNPYPFLKSYVFSRTLAESPDPEVTLVRDRAAEVVRELKTQGGKDIWLVGAGELAATLFAADLIDELTLKVNPILLGDGIPLVARLPRIETLELLGSKRYDNGVVLLSYGVRPR